AGGQGLVYILESMVATLDGARASEPQAASDGAPCHPAQDERPAAAAPGGIFSQAAGAAEIAYPYDVELLILAGGPAVRGLRAELATLGDSLRVVDGSGETHVHVHTDRPAEVLATCLRYGTLDQIQIVN